MFSRAFIALLFGSCAVALSACGGGGSSGGALPSGPAPQPAASASASPGSTAPLNPGQSFAYTGTLLQTQFRSQPAPMPTATTLVTVQQTGTVKDQQAFNGTTGLYDGSVAETDTTLLQTSTSQTDTYYGFSTPASNGSTQLLEYGSTWADDNSDTLTYTYASPLVLDELPETSGASWTNSPAATILEDDTTNANGPAFFSKQVVNANGSYTETTTYPPAYATGSSVITQNADGSGSITNVAGAGAVVFGAPQPQGDGTYVLPYSVYSVPSPGPNDQPSVSQNIPAWFTVPPTLFSETDSDLGSQPIPSACHAPSSIASAIEIQRTISRVDTILGYTETQTTSDYRIPTSGVVCVVMNDTQNQYYDWNGDVQHIFSPTPIQVNTIAETLGLTSGASADSARRATTQSAAAAGLSTQAIAAAQMRFYLRVRQLRTLTKQRVVRSVTSYLEKQKGAVL